MGSRCDSVTGHSELVRLDLFDGDVIAGATAGKSELYRQDPALPM